MSIDEYKHRIDEYKHRVALKQALPPTYPEPLECTGDAMLSSLMPIRLEILKQAIRQSKTSKAISFDWKKELETVSFPVNECQTLRVKISRR